MRLSRLLPSLALLSGFSALAQQTYVGRYDIYGGFLYFDSPSINLAERGFHLQAGTRLKTWLSFGFDYTIDTGHTALGPNLFTTTLQTQLGAELAALAAAGKLPPGYSLSVPIDSSTQTYALGPELAYRRWSRVTLFARPAIGVIHETATPRPSDPITAAIVAQLAPGGKKTDWTPFYGAGGSVDVNLTKYFGVRFSADFVHDHLFSDILKNGRNTYRLAVGPVFQFGPNIK